MNIHKKKGFGGKWIWVCDDCGTWQPTKKECELDCDCEKDLLKGEKR